MSWRLADVEAPALGVVNTILILEFNRAFGVSAQVVTLTAAPVERTIPHNLTVFYSSAIASVLVVAAARLVGCCSSLFGRLRLPLLRAWQPRLLVRPERPWQVPAQHDAPQLQMQMNPQLGVSLQKGW